MARGRKDYEKAVIAVESEGFINPHGRILMYDDFEDTPLKWGTAGTGTHFETRQARAAYNRSYGLELDITSDLPPNARYASAFRYIPTDVTERMLIELFWRASDLARMTSFWVELVRLTGTHRETTRLIYTVANQRWEYLDDLGFVVPLPGGGQTFYDNAWNEFTMAIDFAADEYITFKSNNMEVNMGRIALRSVGLLTGSTAMITIAAHNTTANQLLVSIDDVVVRELEV